MRAALNTHLRVYLAEVRPGLAYRSEDSPEHVHALWRLAVERSRSLVDDVIAERGLDSPASFSWPDGRTPIVRVTVLDMIEEYARHTGHADILREPSGRSRG